ncbi:MAG TPA: hypothetical protein VMF66_07830 [Candidatus Acidoferrum sp.]|nr:hypothetical protein [Candidatus Acidoferrum sp.]
MLQWRRQDPTTHTSGQIAVAVITGRPVEDVIEKVGHSHRTTTRELAGVLDHYGFLCPRRCVPLGDPKDLPRLGIAQVHSGRSSRWHWIAIENGRIFDGIWGDAYGIVDWPSDFHITCYLPIED